MDIYVIGNDKRQQFVSEYLNGIYLSTQNELLNLKKGYLVLPLPVTKDGIYITDSDIKLDNLKNISASIVIFGGKIPKHLKVSFDINGNRWYDFYNDEVLTITNAVYTAEAAISLIINETDSSVYNAKCLVAGYGRIGKILCNYLKAMGASVTATSRKESEQAMAKINGINAVSTYDILEYANKSEVIINTAPFMIFNKEIIDVLKNDVLLIDLASKPGGVDFEYAKLKNIKVLHALALPNKFSPRSSGKIIADTILKRIREGV